MKTTSILCALGLAASALACGNGEKGAPAGSARSKTIPTKKATIIYKEFSIALAVPSKWKNQKLGAGSQTWIRPGGIVNSTMTLSESCQGYCSTVAENVAKHLDAQLAMHKGSAHSVEVLERNKVPEGGYDFTLKLEKDGSVSKQYTRIHYQPSWKQAVVCTVVGIGDDVARFAELRSLCSEMKVAKK